MIPIKLRIRKEAKEMLTLKEANLQDAQKEYEFIRAIPENEIYLRVQKDNPASLHVMLASGGYIHHEDTHHIYVRITK